MKGGTSLVPKDLLYMYIFSQSMHWVELHNGM